MVAGAMMPGDARRAEDPQVARVEGEIVGHHVAVDDAEGGADGQRAATMSSRR